MTPSTKGQATKEALRLVWREQAFGMKAARHGLMKIMSLEDATPEQILQAMELLAKMCK